MSSKKKKVCLHDTVSRLVGSGGVDYWKCDKCPKQFITIDEAEKQSFEAYSDGLDAGYADGRMEA